jgi:hypothetical protein
LWYRGALDDLRFYNRSLSLVEAKTLFENQTQ